MSSVERLAREILDARRLALGHATSPQLGASALDGGRIDFRDADGNRVGGIGIGDDGVFRIDHSGGPKPPQPTPPVVTADGGIFRVVWDGSFASNIDDEGELATADCDRVEVHASMDANFVPDRVESFAGAYSSLDGGAFTFGPLPEAGTYYFRLVARSKSNQYSIPSDRVEQELAISSVDLEITDAWLMGEAAQTTADGKNSIFRGPDEPEPDPDKPFKDGDIWFEMTEDGKSIPNIWDEDAGAWVANDDYRQSEIERVQDELRQELDDIVIDGSGTKNFYQPDEPTEGMREGDLWFDVSDQNKPHIFQDGEWVSVRDSYIEDDSVTTDKIAAGAITAESGIIGSIDAGTITVGEMSGARIKAGTVDADTVLVESSIGSTLIKDGAILTDHIKAGAITAESGIIGSIDANVITVGKIKGNQLDADAINGKTITGATIRTASSGSRVELTQDGLKQYNSLGAVIADMSLGEFTVNGGTLTGATVRTSATGDRVEMNTTGVEVIRDGETRARMSGGGMEVLSGGNISIGPGGSLNITDGNLILGEGMIDGSALTEQLSGTAVNETYDGWSVPSGKVWKAINTANIPVPSWATTAYVQCTGYVKFKRYDNYGGEVPTIRLEIAGNSGDWINCPVSDGGGGYIQAVGTCFHTRVAKNLGSTLKLQLLARAPISYPKNSDQRSRIGGIIMFAR